MITTTGDEVFRRLGVVPCERLSPAQQAKVDAIGIDCGELHNAIFADEDFARAALGLNLERIVASMDALKEKIRLSGVRRIVDLGGGCGLVCFEAAARFPDVEFVVTDRAKNALSMGEQWVKRIGLRNVSFVAFDFAAAPPFEIGAKFELAWIDYVFDLMIPEEQEESMLALAESMSPAFGAASAILNDTGKVSIRFGGYTLEGLRALTAATLRHSWLLDGLCSTATGTTGTYARGDASSTSECREFEMLQQQIGSAFWRS
jgi:hypothetical protein